MEILSYTFFQYALIAGTLIAISGSLLGNYIVIRREVQIGHTIANASFLGIILGLMFQVGSYISGIVFSILAAIVIYLLEKNKKITNDSIMEYTSQISIASGIFLLSFLPGLQVDIYSFLFGNILAVTLVDIYMTLGLLLGICIFVSIVGNQFLGYSVSYEISKATKKNGEYIHILFLLLCSILIAIGIKIFGILLIGAFLVLPANIGKILGSSFNQMKFIGICVSTFSVVIGLFLSYIFDAASGASIVIILGILLFLSLLYSKLFTK